MYSFIQVLVYMNKTASGRLRELKNKRKVRLGNPKSGRDRGRLRERSFTRAFRYEVLVTAQTEFHKGGRN